MRNDTEVKLPEPTGYLRTTSGERGEIAEAPYDIYSADHPVQFVGEHRVHNLRLVYTADQLREAVLQERERCAVIAESYVKPMLAMAHATPGAIAAAIRKG